ncbi:cellulase family glycosylhydrolase [Candidatus Saccharibacteria bacterium]|nr:cellulase family glycosylhydrolase [Candidatus Saccharibacteria bacterium]
MESPKLRGVNLGGWLVIEKWMTPTLFAGTSAEDEYTFMQTEGAAAKLSHHRDSFITESDFKWMSKHGINAVRIPVGYWVLSDTAPFISAVTHLDWAMKTALAHNIQVIIDLHALQGSQNGFDHSAKIGPAEWFNNSEYRQSSLDVLEMIAKRYKDYKNFWGLQIINEPKVGILHLTLRRFYKDAYARLTPILHTHTRIIFSDAFSPRLFSGILKHRTHPVVMDVHLYHMTKLFAQFFSLDWYYRVLQRRKKLLTRLSRSQPVIIGEWSGALRQTAYDRIPQPRHDELTKDYIAHQLSIYEDVIGWFYWNYKTEKPGVWSFKSQVDDGVINLHYTD